jgi:hypothetical protein
MRSYVQRGGAVWCNGCKLSDVWCPGGTGRRPRGTLNKHEAFAGLDVTVCGDRRIPRAIVIAVASGLAPDAEVE